MAEFTFLELHFEDGLIPAVDGLRADSDGQEHSGSTENDESGGVGLGPLVLGLVVLALGVVLVRKLLAGNGDDIDLEA